MLAITFWFGLPRYRCGLDLGDEGALAYGAARVLEGQVPNLDFVSVHPPLPFYTVAVAFRLFGTTLLTLHGFGLVLFVLIGLEVYALARQFQKPAESLVIAVPSVFLGISFTHFVPYAVWQAMSASLAAAFCYLQAIASARVGWATAAGCLTGAALFSRQDQGVYLVIATVAFTTGLWFVRASDCPPETQAGRSNISRIAKFWLGGLAAVLLPLTIYLGWKGALPELFRQTMAFPLTVYARTSSSPVPPLLDLFKAGPNIYILLYYFVPFCAIAAAAWLSWLASCRRFGRAEARLAYLAVLSGLFFCQVLARSDLPHLLVTLPPFFVLAGCGFQLVSGYISKWATTRWSFAIPMARNLVAAFGIGVVVWFLWLMKPFLFQPPLPASLTLTCARGQVRIPSASDLDGLVQTVSQLAPSGSPILCLPYQSMLYFLCQRRNPTRWNALWPGDQTPDEHLALVRQANNDPPAVVVIFEEAKLQTYAAAILDYVHKNYQLAADASGVVRIYVPKP